jgi:hypothetical protein
MSYRRKINTKSSPQGQHRPVDDSVVARNGDMTRPIKSEATDAAEKLMLDLMDKHPGASENSLLELFQKAAKERPDVLRAVVGYFMKHGAVH